MLYRTWIDDSILFFSENLFHYKVDDKIYVNNNTFQSPAGYCSVK